jgi:hypothetical protein
MDDNAAFRAWLATAVGAVNAANDARFQAWLRACGIRGCNLIDKDPADHRAFVVAARRLSKKHGLTMTCAILESNLYTSRS